MKNNTIKIITQKELKDYFYSPLATIFIIVFLGLNFWFFFADFFVLEQASLRIFFTIAPFSFLIFLPSVTMSSWSEEKKMGTLETLLTYPLKDWEIVVSKFLSSFIFVFITLLLSFPLAILVSILGDLDWGVVWGGYTGLIFMAMAAIAIGLFISSLTTSSIASFIITFFILLIFYLIGENVFLSYLPNFLERFFSQLSLSYHFQSVARGVLDFKDILYYSSVTLFFLYLNILSLESRKWE